MVAALRKDYRTAPISEQDRHMLEYVVKLTQGRNESLPGRSRQAARCRVRRPWDIADHADRLMVQLHQPRRRCPWRRPRCECGGGVKNPAAALAAIAIALFFASFTGAGAQAPQPRRPLYHRASRFATSRSKPAFILFTTMAHSGKNGSLKLLGLVLLSSITTTTVGRIFFW